MAGWPGRKGPRNCCCGWPGAGEGRAGAPGRGIAGADGNGRPACCCCRRRSISGLGGTTGRACGCPANGRAPCGRGAIGAFGVRFDLGREGAGRGGRIGVPGTIGAVGAAGIAGGAPGAMTCVGGWTRGAPGAGDGGRSGAAGRGVSTEAGEAGRNACCWGAGFGASGGSGCRGPLGGATAAVRGGDGNGRAGMEILRFATPGADGWACGEASGG